MTKDEIRALADALLATLDHKGHRLAFVETRQRARHPGEWAVIYDLFSPQETLIDGPIVVVVDESTQRAHVMEGP